MSLTRNVEHIEHLHNMMIIHLPVGRDSAIQGSQLADELGVSERMVRALIEDLVQDQGWLIGSVCSGDRPGYFICATREDVEAGVSHLVARARSLHVRVAALRRAAEERFAPDDPVLRLFDLEEVS